jgi:hypothetical protein
MASHPTPPFVPANQWALSIRGQVNNPFTFTYPQLLAQPTVSEIVKLKCEGYRIAGEAISTAEWEGVKLKKAYWIEQASGPMMCFGKSSAGVLIFHIHVDFGLPRFTPLFFANVR